MSKIACQTQADGKLLFVSNSKSSEQPVFCLGMEGERKKKKRLLRNWADKTGMREQKLGSQRKCQEPSGCPLSPRGAWALPPAQPLPTQQQLEQCLAAVLTRMLFHKQQIN